MGIVVVALLGVGDADEAQQVDRAAARLRCSDALVGDQRFRDLLADLQRRLGSAMVLITHDLGVVAGMCERVNVMYAGMFMETGSAEQLFERPRHPYTLGLLQSVPRLDATRRAKLQPIEGAPRNMLRPPSACPFQPRCRYEVDLSRKEVPPLVEIEPGHMLACFNPVPAEEWERTRVAVTA